MEVLVCLLQLGCCDPDLPVCRDVLTSFVQNLGKGGKHDVDKVEKVGDREEKNKVKRRKGRMRNIASHLPIDKSCCKKKYLQSVSATHLPCIFIGL